MRSAARGHVRVELDIDRLVLHETGRRVDGRALGAAIEAELTRLLTDNGLPEELTGGARARVRAPAVRFPAPGAGREPHALADTHALARGIAAAIHGGLGS